MFFFFLSFLRRLSAANMIFLGTVGGYNTIYVAHICILLLQSYFDCDDTGNLNLFLFTFVLMDNVQNHLSS